MYRKSSFGKLIVSKNNDYYVTFHDLNMILIKGNGNNISIEHKVTKIVINGNNNDVEIGFMGNVEEIIFNGNNNNIFAKFIYSLPNVCDTYNNGMGNKIYVKKNNFDKEKEKPLQKYEDEEEDEKDDEEEKKTEEKKEENKGLNIGINKNSISDDKYDDNNDGNDTNEDELFDYDDIFDYYDDFPRFPLSEIQSQLQMQIQREREKELFRASLASIVFGNSHYDSAPHDENVLSDLIDITFKNISKGVKEGNEKCVICYDNFKENENVKMTSCFHIFHFKCIKKWVESREELTESPDCPICRRKL